MLDCAPWMLTHSSVGAVELAPPLEPVPPPELETTKASRDAVVVAGAGDREGEGEPGDGEPVCEADPVCAGDGDAARVKLPDGMTVGVAVVEDAPAEGEVVCDEVAGGEVAAGEVVGGEVVGDEVVGVGVGEGDGDGEDEGDGDGDGEDEGDGDRDGEDDGEDGSAWHTGFAAAAAVACDTSGAASALPGTLRVRKPPLSSVTAATRTCPKRIRIACPR
jgi:hypothetical protein